MERTTFCCCMQVKETEDFPYHYKNKVHNKVDKGRKEDCAELAKINISTISYEWVDGQRNDKES
ncbi:CLUMA_CG013923, isoform A [Clunio marinus]|uniref:CLUMA_CG013923, isoform A n=1 Tax=Clunio marinus TaxID=568069 RepID=A0A1J1IKA0_9DIPT|nr:CLUMA_CG013923, isoform A [Clunio marinus]